MNLPCDSSTLISLAENCLLWLVRDFSVAGTNFYITPIVKYESIDHPLQINRFEFEAYKIQKLIDEGHLKLKITPSLKEDTKIVLNLANRSFISKHGPIKIIHDGEAEVLALTLGMDKYLGIDEKTTRLLVEYPEKLREILEEKTHHRVRVDGNILKKFTELVSGVKVIRSSEIVAIAYERGMMERYGKGKKILNAALWGVRTGGCSITKDEINQLSV
jgi:hypothetical protein